MNPNIDYYNGKAGDSSVYYNEEYGPIADDFEATKDMYFNGHMEEKSGKSILKKTETVKDEEKDLRISKNRSVKNQKRSRKRHRKQEYDEEHYALPYIYDLVSKNINSPKSRNNNENQYSKVFFALFIWTAILGIVGGVIYFIYYLPEAHGEFISLSPT